MTISDSTSEPMELCTAYRSFLIRCRLTGPGEPGDELVWRFTVEQAGRSDLRRCFASLSDVEMYLRAEIARCELDAYPPG
jgi:hypothetical protein